jgi:phosphatidate cytidylyltransferase
MADADPAARSRAKGGGGELALRVVSALVLAPLAVGIAYLGGWIFAVFWGLAALLVLWEWSLLVTSEDHLWVFMAGGAPVVLALALAASHHPLGVTIVMIVGAFGAAVLAFSGRRGWAAAGVIYAGIVGLAPIVLRSDRSFGFVAIIFLFAIVWATDVFAYFGGRAVGGAKLMPRVSPNKTWAGAVAGTGAAVLAGGAVAKMAGLPALPTLAVIAALLSVCAQAGDLFESYLKRMFGAKDSGHLIPGHGGLMDRLDGFIAAALIAALIGLWRGGLDAPADGLLVW